MNWEILIASVALVISVGSALFSYYSWRESNRPLVTALVAEHASGSLSSIFDLILSNTGGRPAVNVRIFAEPAEIALLTDPEASEKLKDAIANCFSEESMVPVLRNGEELRTAFGSYHGDDAKSKWLNYGVVISIRLTYEDIDGRGFVSNLPLKIFARSGFGGSSWQVGK